MARPFLERLGARSIEIPLDGDGLPAAFRLFKAGENETTKGVFLFDDEAARSVMEAATAHGVDLMLDLEHLSLDQESNAYDPDARAWFRLELRGGELWAVDVRWTDDGARRLRERTQRYISPAFSVDDEDRVTEIVNVALVAMPATHGTPALVAANRRSRMQPTKTMKDALNLLTARLSLAQKAVVKLADGEGESGKGAAVQSAAQKASEALDALQQAFGAGDIDAIFGAMDAAKSAMDACENAIAAMTGAPPDADAAPAADAQMADKPADEDDDKGKQMSVADLAELMTLRADKAKRETEEAARKLAAETEERRVICAGMVRSGMRPSDVWADESASAPKALFHDMPIAKLRELAKTIGARITESGPRPPNGGGMSVEVNEQIVSEEEVTYLKARHLRLAGEGMKLRAIEDTIARYSDRKRQQLAGADGDFELSQKLARKVDARTLSWAGKGGLITLASTPVKPIEEFGASSQIALQSFRLEYNLALAAMAPAWAEVVGRVLPDGAMKTTFPLNFRALKYREKTNSNPSSGGPINRDIEVTKRSFSEGQQIELKRLVKGDFAYVNSWAQLAQDLARARIYLRNELVTALLEAGTSGYWGQTSSQSTGIDGQAFFSASHAVNPVDATKQLRGSASWSNYQSSAKPLNANNLTGEKAAAFQVAAPDGRELGVVFDGILYPSSLEQTAVNLLTVQQLLLDAASSLNGVSNAMGGGNTNVHYQSGMQLTRGGELAGTDTTANYYLYSREAIARGLDPWVISEDPSEEVRIFDETSDFYKTTGEIRYESHVDVAAVLLYPHAIRLVKGA